MMAEISGCPKHTYWVACCEGCEPFGPLGEVVEEATDERTMKDRWSLMLALITEWNHTDACYGGEVERCDCGLTRVLDLAKKLEDLVGGDSSRWIDRMKKLEQRNMLASAILKGDEDDMLALSEALEK